MITFYDFQLSWSIRENIKDNKLLSLSISKDILKQFHKTNSGEMTLHISTIAMRKKI